MDNNEQLFWKVYKNKFLVSLIFQKIYSYEKTITNFMYYRYKFEDRSKFKYINSLKFIVSNDLLPLLKCKLENNEYIKFDQHSIGMLFSRNNSITTNSNYNYDLFNQILSLLAEKKRNEFEKSNLLRLASKHKNLNAIKILLELYNGNKLNLRPIDSKTFNYLIKAQGIDQHVMNQILTRKQDLITQDTILDINGLFKITCTNVQNQFLDLNCFQTSNEIIKKHVISNINFSKLVNIDQVLTIIKVLSTFNELHLSNNSDITSILNNINYNDQDKIKQLLKLIVFVTNDIDLFNQYLNQYDEILSISNLNKDEHIYQYTWKVFSLIGLEYLINCNYNGSGDGTILSINEFDQIKDTNKIIGFVNLFFKSKQGDQYFPKLNKIKKSILLLDKNQFEIVKQSTMVSLKLTLKWNQLLKDIILLNDNKSKLYCNDIETIDWLISCFKQGIFNTTIEPLKISNIQFNSLSLCKYANEQFSNQLSNSNIQFTLENNCFDYYFNSFNDAITNCDIVSLKQMNRDRDNPEFLSTLPKSIINSPWNIQTQPLPISSIINLIEFELEYTPHHHIDILTKCFIHLFSLSTPPIIPLSILNQISNFRNVLVKLIIHSIQQVLDTDFQPINLELIKFSLQFFKIQGIGLFKHQFKTFKTNQTKKYTDSLNGNIIKFNKHLIRQTIQDLLMNIEFTTFINHAQFEVVQKILNLFYKFYILSKDITIEEIDGTRKLIFNIIGTNNNNNNNNNTDNKSIFNIQLKNTKYHAFHHLRVKNNKLAYFILSRPAVLTIVTRMPKHSDISNYIDLELLEFDKILNSNFKQLLETIEMIILKNGEDLSNFYTGSNGTVETYHLNSKLKYFLDIKRKDLFMDYLTNLPIRPCSSGEYYYQFQQSHLTSICRIYDYEFIIQIIENPTIINYDQRFIRNLVESIIETERIDLLSYLIENNKLDTSIFFTQDNQNLIQHHNSNQLENYLQKYKK